MSDDKKIARLRELVSVITTPREDRDFVVMGELTMRIPAEPDRDADLVLSWAADEIERLKARATAGVGGCGNHCEACARRDDEIKQLKSDLIVARNLEHLARIDLSAERHRATPAGSERRGLTIRQQAVLMAMQGALSNVELTHDAPAEIADWAIRVADACLKAERESRK